MPPRIIPRLLCTLSALAVGGVFAQVNSCGDPFRNHFGPFDYRVAPLETRKLVEDHHFTLGVEAMTRPKNTMMQDMAQDVAYVLGVFPNHPRALLTMMRLSEKHKVDPPPGTAISVECWFDRAVRFRPDDVVARALFARFLHKHKRVDEALRQMEMAANHAGDNPTSTHNIGLVYFEMGEHKLALAQAHKAIRLGYPPGVLADQLQRIGKWADPPSQ